MKPGNIFSKQQIAWARTMESRSKSQWSRIFVFFYSLPILRRLCFRLVTKLEGGQFFSQSLRLILQEYYGVWVGKYSYGSCLTLGLLPRGTVVGSYCSFADGLKIFRRNHPIDALSQHPFFYNKLVGLVFNDTINSNEDNPLVVGNDVWVGYGVTILPGCKMIGDGAIVGAGAVVTRNVEPFTIVAGNPAKFIKRRFSDDVVQLIKLSRWWDLSLSELLDADDLLIRKVDKVSMDAFVNKIGPPGARNE